MVGFDEHLEPSLMAVARLCRHWALGSTIFDYFGQHRDQARIFSAAMTDLSTRVIREAASLMDVGGARYAVDVGGANGTFVSELVKRNPNLTGAVFDLPHVVAVEGGRRGLADRVTGIAGDFFDSVRPADIYLLKFILHDWADPSCMSLLSLMDMGILFSLGQERSLVQFEALLNSARLATTNCSSCAAATGSSRRQPTKRGSAPQDLTEAALRRASREPAE